MYFPEDDVKVVELYVGAFITLSSEDSKQAPNGSGVSTSEERLVTSRWVTVFPENPTLERQEPKKTCPRCGSTDIVDGICKGRVPSTSGGGIKGMTSCMLNMNKYIFA